MKIDVKFGAAEASSDETKLKNLPEWNLTDLYPSMGSDEFSQDIKTCKEWQST